LSGVPEVDFAAIYKREMAKNNVFGGF